MGRRAFLAVATVLMASPSLATDVADLEVATREMERRGLLAPDFNGWMQRQRPEMRWDYPHLRHIHRRLDEVTSADVLRLLLQVSGRHGKTESVTSYGAYRLDLDPGVRILLVTYSQPQARKLSRQIRSLARDSGVELSRERDSVDEWETLDGGGVRAVGIGAGTASINADLILIDDPIGRRADAESAAHRDTVWDALTTDILARCEPHTAVVFSMPRWHLDDPAGRLQDRQGERWTLVDLPGRAEEDDELGREPGEVLWPELRDEDWHDGMLAEMGSYGYASFIGCRPRPREGGMFEWDWWQLIDEVPEAVRMVRYWDTAGTDVTGENDPDYTVGTLGCRMADERTAIVDVERFRLSIAKRDARIAETAKADREKYGHRVHWWFETESGVGGKDRTAAILRMVQALGITCHTEPASGSKTLRAEPLASAAEAGNVVLCPGRWRDPFRLEAADFPGGAHDDQVDSAAGMFNKLADVRAPITSVASPVGY